MQKSSIYTTILQFQPTSHPRSRVLDVLTHQPLNTHQSPIPDFGIIMSNQLDQSRLAIKVRNCLFGLVSTMGDEFANIMSCDREHDWVF